MANQLDAAIILSQTINPDGSLSAETRQRVDKGLELLFRGSARYLAMSGGRDSDKDPCIHAYAMRQYAIDQGAFPGKILTEDTSRDTVGQLALTKKKLVVPNDWRNLIIISHDYHMRRVVQIASFVFGFGYDLKFADVQSGRADDVETLKKEKRSVDDFLRTFEGILPGDTEGIVRRMYEAHPLYRKAET